MVCFFFNTFMYTKTLLLINGSAAAAQQCDVHEVFIFWNLIRTFYIIAFVACVVSWDFAAFENDQSSNIVYCRRWSKNEHSCLPTVGVRTRIRQYRLPIRFFIFISKTCALPATTIVYQTETIRYFFKTFFSSKLFWSSLDTAPRSRPITFPIATGTIISRQPLYCFFFFIHPRL